MDRRGVACAGNWILDIVHDIPAWPAKSDLVRISAQASGLGGGAANVSADLVALGGGYPVRPVGLVGAGALGDEMLSLCAAAGLDTSRIGRSAAAATAQTHVMNVPGDSRTFFYHAGVNDLLGPDHVDVPGLAAAGTRILYLGYVNLLAALDRPGPDGRPVAAAVLAEARAAGMLTCVDLVSSQAADYHRTVFGVLPEVDVLLLNEVEAARATGCAIAGDADEPAMLEAASRLAEGGVRRAVVMHTPARVLWFEAGEGRFFHPQPVPAEAVPSPVGAGDAFAAGVIHGLHEGWAQAETVALACDAARACLGAQTATGGLGPKLLDRG